MFYEPEKNNHGLPYNPFKSICVPRPIAWVSTLNNKGELNLAPFSQFNNVSYDPPFIMFSSGERPDGRHKDTVANCNASGEFCLSLATYELREAVNITAQLCEPGIDEAKLAGLEMLPSKFVKPPRVAASPIHMEGKVHSIIALPGMVGPPHHVVIGRIVGIHIRDDVITADGKIDILKVRPLARLGYFDYTSVESKFTMPPVGPDIEASRTGMEGRPAMPVTNA
jgi:flavin reductase (DIM6/NTAB) family NADH-FMN oxidoreductase RutF